MRLALVVAACAVLLGSVLPVPLEPASVTVWRVEPSGDGWSVHWSYRDVEVTSWQADRASADCLYAVLAGVMIGGAQ